MGSAAVEAGIRYVERQWRREPSHKTQRSRFNTTAKLMTSSSVSFKMFLGSRRREVL